MRMTTAWIAVFWCGAILGTGTPAQAQEDLLDDLESKPSEQPSTPVDDDDLTTSLDDIETSSEKTSPEDSAPGSPDQDETARSGTAENPATLDRIKAVPRKRLLKKNRLELSPSFSLSVNDAFYQNLALSGSLIYYPHDSFGIGVGASYFFVRSSTNNIEAVRKGFVAVPAIIEPPKLFAHLDFYWLPLYGKISLFDTYIVHFDFYLGGGLGVASAFDGRAPPLANVFLGQRFVIGDWLAFRFEVRDHLYVDRQRVDTQPRSDIQNYLMLQFGVSFFIPPSFEYSLL